MSEELQSITNAEDRQSQGQHAGVSDRGILVVYGTGAAGKDKPDGMMRLDFRDGGAAGKDYGKDILFPHPACNQLSILAAEIKDDDRGSIHASVSHARSPELYKYGQPGHLEKVARDQVEHGDECPPQVERSSRHARHQG